MFAVDGHNLRNKGVKQQIRHNNKTKFLSAYLTIFT